MAEYFNVWATLLKTVKSTGKQQKGKQIRTRKVSYMSDLDKKNLLYNYIYKNEIKQ